MTDSLIPAFLDRCLVINERNADGLDITSLYGRSETSRVITRGRRTWADLSLEKAPKFS